MKKVKAAIISLLSLCMASPITSQALSDTYWHGKYRRLNYQPNGEEFVSQNGTNRFTRAIYGTNSGFRFETSDFPEFGLYMPNLGGSVYMAISAPTGIKWIKDLESIESRFKSGQRSYVITDKVLLGKGQLRIDAVALSDADGMIVQYEADQLPKGCKLIWIYGGANHKRFNREGDIGADPKDCFHIKPENCIGNVFETDRNTFILNYGHTAKVISNDEAYENAETFK
ncbi:MAG: DUF4450 domain-containing protein, partial [Bacteroides sp.]|nr:DUF4450 domain-containing protein [Bacteroides sp.]